MAHDKQHVDCRARWAKAAPLLGTYAPDLAVVSEVGRDEFQQHFASTGNTGNSSVVVAIEAIVLFMNDLDAHIFPLLGDVTRFPHIDQ